MTADPTIPLLLTRGDVADLLNVELNKLTWWFWVLEARRRYSTFEIERRNGDPRSISAPIQPIKVIQRRLADLLIRWYSPPNHVHGFVSGRDPRTNARPHRRQQWILRVDLADFFPSINFGRVRGMFMAHPFDFSEEAATMLAQVCCHRNQLPQGAPTSPIISNFICRQMDRKVSTLAREERCYFTRYADDLTFSTDRTVFPSSLAFAEGSRVHVGPALAKIIETSGFTANDDKTRLVRRWQRQRVTGLIVNDKLNVPRDYVRGLRSLLFIWKRYGLEAAERAFARTDPHPNRPPGKLAAPFKESVRGRVQYVGSVKGWSSAVYLSLAAGLAELDPAYRYRAAQLQPDLATRGSRRRKIPVVHQLHLCTEGGTDQVHLFAALRHFQKEGEFVDLRLKFGDDSTFGSDSALQKHLRNLPANKPTVPTGVLFDRDNEKLLRDEGLLQDDYSDRGNGVFAATLVLPPFRKEWICIEMLYTDAELSIKNVDRRRIYLRSEFDEETGQHDDEPCHITNLRNQTLVRDDVHEFTTRKSLALSKKRFAELVDGGQPPFDGLSFDGFRPTMTMLREAVLAVEGKIS